MEEVGGKIEGDVEEKVDKGKMRMSRGVREGKENVGGYREVEGFEMMRKKKGSVVKVKEGVGVEVW